MSIAFRSYALGMESRSGILGWMDGWIVYFFRRFSHFILTFTVTDGVYGVNDEILGISVSTNISRTSLIKSSPLDIPSHDKNFEIYYSTLSFTRETKIIYKSYKYEFSSLGTCLLKDILYNWKIVIRFKELPWFPSRLKQFERVNLWTQRVQDGSDSN